MALVGAKDGEVWRPLPKSQQGRGPVVRKAPSPQPRDVFRVQPAPQPVVVQAAPAAPAVQQAVQPATTYVDLGVARPAPVVQVVQPDHLALPMPEPANRDPRTLDQALRSTWDNLENEGASGAVKARESGLPPQALQTIREQQMLNMADHYNTMAHMGERDRARREREARDRKEKAKPMTAEEWNAYSPLQQAAVQANADLAQAIRRDVRMQSKHHATREQLKAYQDRADELFGKEGQLGFGGIEYAPNTIAFLDERGIDRQALAGKTLDDLISGDALMTKKTIDNIGAPAPDRKVFSTEGMSRREANLAFAQSIAKGQLQYQEEIAAKLKVGDQLLTSMTGHTTAQAADDTYGAKKMPAQQRLTDVRPETAQMIDKYMEGLARPDLDPVESMRMIELDLQERGADQKEIDQVYQSMQDRVRLGMQGEGNWFPGVDYKLRSPAEVAQVLGVPTLKRAEG